MFFVKSDETTEANSVKQDQVRLFILRKTNAKSFIDWNLVKYEQPMDFTKFQSIKLFAFVFRKINNLTWSCLTEFASVVSSLLTKNIN